MSNMNVETMETSETDLAYDMIVALDTITQLAKYLFRYISNRYDERACKTELDLLHQLMLISIGASRECDLLTEITYEQFSSTL